MDYIIREMREDEYPLLKEFLYEAVYVAKGAAPPDRSITDSPELQVYIRDFGSSRHDSALVAEVNGDIIGAVWVRIMDDYGHIDDETPSLAISVLGPFRKSGIGTALLNDMIAKERAAGYSRLSLSVQKANYAVEMYRKAGFYAVSENEYEYIMAIQL